MRPVFLALIIAVAANSTTDAQQPGPACDTSPTVRTSAPPDPNAAPVHGDFYINADRSIWVAVPANGWPSGGHVFRGNRPIKGQKTYWVRPQGAPLQITGRRLDGEGTVEADIPCCYTSGFHIVALHFATAGCWEVTATSGDRVLQFVTKVRSAVTALGQ